MNDRKMSPVSPKQIHHFWTASKYSSLRHTGRPRIIRFATPQTVLRIASLSGTSFQPSPASSPLVKCLSNVYWISSSTSGKQALICLVKSLRMTVKSCMEALLGPDASHSRPRTSSCALVAAMMFSGCCASHSASHGGSTTDGQWRDGLTNGFPLLLY